MRVLLAEDDELLGSGLKAGLQQQGFWVDWVRDGVAASRARPRACVTRSTLATEPVRKVQDASMPWAAL